MAGKRQSAHESSSDGIELKPVVTIDKVASNERGGSISESLSSSSRFKEFLVFVYFSSGVFAFGVINDFIQESVFRIEDFDYGLLLLYCY